MVLRCSPVPHEGLYRLSGCCSIAPEWYYVVLRCSPVPREGLYTDYQGAVQWSLSGTLGGPMRFSS